MKKNVLKIFTILACMVLVIGLFAACGDKAENAANQVEEIANEVNEAIDDAVEEIDEAVDEAVNEAAGGALVGEWVYTGGDYVYTFNDDGTGSYTAGETVMEFTYVDSGSAVEIQYATATVPNNYEYTIDGDKLLIADDFGDTVEYTRK